MREKNDKIQSCKSQDLNKNEKMKIGCVKKIRVVSPLVLKRQNLQFKKDFQNKKMYDFQKI